MLFNGYFYSAHNLFPYDGSIVKEITNDIKDKFVMDYYDGKSPTLKQYCELYSKYIDVDEFLDWGLEFAMLHAVEFNKNEQLRKNQKTKQNKQSELAY